MRCTPGVPGTTRHCRAWLGADVVIDAAGAEADGSFLQHVTSATLKLQGGSPVALNWAIDSVRKNKGRTGMPYTADKPPLAETPEQLRARIPGWGADLDPRDRPAYPRERFAPEATGAHWDFPERQPGWETREKSVEHGRRRRSSAPPRR